MACPDLFQELLEKLTANWQGLPDKPDETPFSTLCALWNTAAQQMDIALETNSQLPPLEPHSAELLKTLVNQRIAGSPLAYLTGTQTYMGLTFYASPEAMIPRKETELLGVTGLEVAHRLASERGSVHALDLCTGSGNVALALANFVDTYQGFASDISADAVRLAERNASLLGVEERVQFLTGDLFEPFNNRGYDHAFDLITCNPPYIASANTEKMAAEIAQFEPREAFDGGPFGINLIVRLIREAPGYLKPASWLIFEVGLGQGEAVSRMLAKTSAYQEIENRADESGQIRVLMVRTQ